MRGSLAVWCDKATGHDNVAVDLHFNMWGDLPRKGRFWQRRPDVLDIGIKFKPPFPTKLYFYFPGKITRDLVSDLSGVLRSRKTLAAVFNDTMEIEDEGGPIFRTINSRKSDLWISRLDPRDLECEHIEAGEGTVIAIAQKTLQEFTADKENYVRFRVRLEKQLRWLFFDEGDPVDNMFISSFVRTRIVEFRLNEKRNLSEQLLQKYPNCADFLQIDTLHYLLVRHMRVELSRSHATYRKMRRLEPELWGDYLREFGEPNMENMVIYHWREPDAERCESDDETSKGVEDFVALCAFRELRNNLYYVPVIVLLGAVGNAIEAYFTDRLGWMQLDTAVLQFFLALLFALSLFLLLLLNWFRHLLRSKRWYAIRTRYPFSRHKASAS